jgi:hypothetical protein
MEMMFLTFNHWLQAIPTLATYTLKHWRLLETDFSKVTCTEWDYLSNSTTLPCVASLPWWQKVLEFSSSGNERTSFKLQDSIALHFPTSLYSPSTRSQKSVKNILEEYKPKR